MSNKALRTIANARDAMAYGHFPDVDDRVMITITYDEAYELWQVLSLAEHRRQSLVVDASLRDGEYKPEFVPVPPEPKRGMIWGRILGVRVYVLSDEDQIK